MIKTSSVILVLHAIAFVVVEIVGGSGSISKLFSGPPFAIALTITLYVSLAMLILGTYFYCIVAGFMKSIRILAQELTSDNVTLLNLAVEAYGGRGKFLEDVALRLDRDSQRVIKQLLVEPDVLMIDMIVKCLNTDFFSWASG